LPNLWQIVGRVTNEDFLVEALLGDHDKILSADSVFRL
jgi:hypothetical protein